MLLNLNYCSTLPKCSTCTCNLRIDTIITQEDDSLVNSLIHFAQSLKLRVVAEGVETQEQMEYLRQYGCNLIQGYYFSRPLPPADALLLLEKQVQNRTT